MFFLRFISLKKKIALFSAFPQELTHLRKIGTPLKPGNPSFPMFVIRHLDTEIIAVRTGMSTTNLEAAFKHVMAEYRPDIILSIGFGGALYYRVNIGELVFASRYFFYTPEGLIELPQLSLHNANGRQSPVSETIITRLQQKIRIKEGSFVTLSEWMTKSKLKACIPGGVPFPVCDRETIHLAKMSYKNHVPFYAIRSITDTLDQDIPEELFHVTDGNGNYRLSRALGLLLRKPSLVPDSVKLGRNAAIASGNLCEAVKAIAEILSAPQTAMTGKSHNSFDLRREGARNARKI